MGYNRSTMEYRVRRDWLRRMIVYFTCERCRVDLQSPLDEAGSQQNCPTCQHPFLTPGIEALEAIRYQAHLKQAERAKLRLWKDKNRREEKARRAYREGRWHPSQRPNDQPPSTGPTL